MSKRIIAIRHRRKKSADGEARPTQVGVFNPEGTLIQRYDLDSETQELDWIKGKTPISHRKALETDDISLYPAHQIEWKELKNKVVPANLFRDFFETVNKKEVKVAKYADKVPNELDGLQTGDTILMVYGGSGNRMVSAACKRGKYDQLELDVYRIAPDHLAEARKKNNLSQSEKDSDVDLLVKMFLIEREKFSRFTARDLESIYIKELYTRRQEAMKAKVACELRIHGRAVGQAFLAPEGYFPEGALEDIVKSQLANDTILKALKEEDDLRYKELKKAVNRHSVNKEIFSKVAGCGPRIVAALIATIGDIHRFPTEPQFLTFCGVTSRGGKLPVRRKGERMNWNPEVRQALFLFHEQINMQGEKTEWGKLFLQIKAELRQAHPEPIPLEGKGWKTMYSNGHIHKMARWKFLNKFCCWLYKEWSALN